MLIILKKKIKFLIVKFFTDQSANFDPSQIVVTELGFDLDDVKLDIDDCLEKSKVMVSRLDVLNEDIVQYLIQNSGNKQTKILIERAKKKLEKQVLDMKGDMGLLSDRLEQTQVGK